MVLLEDVEVKVLDDGSGKAGVNFVSIVDSADIDAGFGMILQVNPADVVKTRMPPLKFKLSCSHIA